MDDLRLQFPAITELLQQHAPIPAYSLLLGIGDDGIPLMLDLTEPGAGSFLVASDSLTINQRILNSMLISAYQQNTQYELSVHLISAEDHRHLHSKNFPQIRNVYSPDDPACEVLLEEVGQLLNKRQDNRIQLPVQLLVLDQITKLMDVLSPSAKRLLLRLIKHGPFWGIWVVGTILTTQLDASYFEMIESFPSRIVGKIMDDAYARYFTGLPRANLRELTPLEALVRLGEDVFSVRIPETKPE